MGQQPFDDIKATVDGGPWPLAPTRLPSALWNLDRVDQRGARLDGRFVPAAGLDGGRGVVVYHLDSGVRASHREFGGRAAAVADFTKTHDADCSGHGTHTASVAIGEGVGIARGATLRAYKVLGCGGEGRSSSVVAAVDAILGERRGAGGAAPPGVALMSLSTRDQAQAAGFEAAVAALLQANVSVVAASGNEGPGDACAGTPARVYGVLTVAGSDLTSKFSGGGAGGVEGDPIYPYSLTGPCVSLFAPGADVLGACASPDRCTSPGDAAYAWASGTSMAAPHVAGAAALYLGAHPGATPAEVKGALTGQATRGALGGGLSPGTPNLLLYVGEE